MNQSDKHLQVKWGGGKHEVHSKDDVCELWTKKGFGGLSSEKRAEEIASQMGLVTYQLTLDRISDYVDRAPGRRALEIGCGWGRIFIGMKRRYPDLDYTGIDLTPNLVELSKQHAAEFQIPQPYRHEVGDAGNLNFEDESFDVLYSVRVFQYVLDVPRAMAEAYRVLKPAGWFAILLPNGYNPVRKRRYKTKLPKASEMRNWFRSAGFGEIETSFLGFMPTIRHLPMKPLDRLAEAVGKLPGVKRLGVHVVVAGRKQS